MWYVIRTAYGSRYLCDKDGYVLEFSNGLRKNPESESRKTWQIIGAWYNVGFGHIHSINLQRLAVVDPDYLTMSNGKPDMD